LNLSECGVIVLKQIMRIKIIVVLVLAIPSLAVASFAQNYTAEKTTDHGIDVVHLTDAVSGVEVAIAPTYGNLAYEMKVHGKNILFFPLADVSELKKTRAAGGNPFLAPWSNRLGELDFWANGKKYIFNTTLGNIRLPVPIHGVLLNSPYWEVIEVKADKKSAHVTSRLQFWKYPDMMAQWPFAHEYEMTYELSGGVLEVRLAVINLSADPMPVSIGFHPCFQLPDGKRDDWTMSIPARKVVLTDERQVATGEYKPFDLPNPLPLKGQALDTGYVDLVRDSAGRAHFSIDFGSEKIEGIIGARYPTAMVYTPPNSQAACLEPMAGISNAVNLNHEGKYPDLQMLAPGAKWVESFWVRSGGI
jgi:aldose 1-epimerase